MADEQKPGGSGTPPPSGSEAPAQPSKPAAESEKPVEKPAEKAAAPPEPKPLVPAAEPDKPAAAKAAPPSAGAEKPTAPPPPAAEADKPAPPPAAPKPAAPAAGAEKPAAAAATKPAAPAAAGGHAPPKPPPAMAATPWESDLVKELKENFGDAITEASTYLGQNFVVARPDSAIPVLEYLKLEADFDYLVDITAVDWPKRAERFDVVYILYSFSRNERLRVKTYIAEGYKPETAVGVHLTANWLEREVYDMFGIEFAGHPDMRRILLPEEWEGFPLRKDYSILKQDDRWVQENLGIPSGQ